MPAPIAPSGLCASVWTRFISSVGYLSKLTVCVCRYWLFSDVVPGLYIEKGWVHESIEYNFTLPPQDQPAAAASTEEEEEEEEQDAEGEFHLLLFNLWPQPET